MGNNVKHFLIGALIASAPTALYVKANLDHKRPKPLQMALSFNTDYLPTSEIEMSLVKNEPKPAISETPTPTSKPIATPIPTVILEESQPIRTASFEIKSEHLTSEVYTFIEKYAGEYGVDKKMMYQIAKCESGLRSDAVNGSFGGVYQFLASTWVSNRNAMGLDPNPELRFHAEEAVKTAAFKMSQDGFSAWPTCSSKARYLLSVEK
jgi:hypothetical protein